MSNREVIRKKKESVFRGLTDVTRFEIAKQKLNDCDEIIKYVYGLEESLMY